MLEFHSLSTPNLLTHIVFSASDFDGRRNIVDPKEFLQVSAIKLSDAEEFQAHVHTWKQCDIRRTVAQEAWVVISGVVETFLYDESENMVGSISLNPGDCCITLNGGHKYKALSNTLVYEFKSGPYLGDTLDKHYI